MKIDANTEYTVTLSFTSTGLDPMVTTSTGFSHDFGPMIEAGEELPAALYLARDVGTMLNLMRYKDSFNPTDEELERMKEDGAIAAIEEAAATAEDTVEVTRLT